MYKPSKERNWKNQQSYNWKIKFIATRKTLLPSVSYFFFIYWSPSLSLWTIFDSISSNIDEVLLINSSANVFVFESFNIHHQDLLTYSSGTDWPGELCYNFSISNDLTQMVNFPIQIPDYDSYSPALLDLFIYAVYKYVLQRLSLHWEILIMLLTQFPLTFHQIHSGMSHFIA